MPFFLLYFHWSQCAILSVVPYPYHFSYVDRSGRFSWLILSSASSQPSSRRPFLSYPFIRFHVFWLRCAMDVVQGAFNIARPLWRKEPNKRGLLGDKMEKRHVPFASYHSEKMILGLNSMQGMPEFFTQTSSLQFSGTKGTLNTFRKVLFFAK